MSRLCALSTLVVFLLSGAWPAGQQASASIDGVVMSTDATPQPIRRAIVTLTGGALATNLSTVSDDRGRFAFADLRPDRYLLTVSKAAYLTMAFGAKQPGRPGTPIALVAGQRLTGLRLTLTRGAVVSGAVRNLAGQPVADVNVTVVAASKANGPTDYASPDEGPIVTDDRGMYRAYGLAPGEYIIGASPLPMRSGALRRLSDGAIDATLRGLQQRTAGGAALGASGPSAPVEEPVAYVTIFYPGTPVAQDATRIRVGAGEVREGLDFVLDLIPSVRIEGRVVTSEGSPVARAGLSLTPVGPPLPMFSMFDYTPQQSPDGTFSYPKVTPGRYVLSASGPSGSAMADLTVRAGDLSGVVLTLRPMPGFAGRVVFDRTTLEVPKDLTKIRVGLSRLEGRDAPGTTDAVPVPRRAASPPSAVLKEDGTFALANLVPAVYVPVVGVPSTSGWWLRSAIVNGRDILDSPLAIDASATDVAGAVLTMSDRHTELSGTFQSSSGQPASDYVVVVLPADRALWGAKRRLRSTRPASDGAFRFADLPAGEYLIAALTDIDDDEWRRPAFLEQVAGASVKVTIADGARVRQDLRIR